MVRSVPAPPPTGLPGARTSCALLTLFTVLLAWPSPPVAFSVLAPVAYFALLTWFFWRTGRTSVALHSQPMRLVTGGFFLLWLGFTVAAAIHFSGLENEYTAMAYLRNACERGAWSLLGTTLIAYGLMLWIPEIVRSNEVLAAHAEAQRGRLREAEHERGELERRLVEADRLGMLGEIAASIAHDLRNPLTIVKGTAESLCRRPRDAREIAEHTDVIRRNVDRANRTIESLIDLARPKASAQVTLCAVEALRETAGLLQVEARHRRVELDVPEPIGPPPKLVADHTLLVQSLMNLALNALQASARGTTITLRVRRVGARVALVVEDRGVGLPPTVRSNLFTPFFTTKQNGTGLGLASCRRIAGELGGDLRLYPRARGGTRAILWLAAEHNETPTREEAACPVNC